MIRRLIILLLIVGCVFAREYIAIIDFEGINVSEGDAKALTQRLTSEMIKLEVYQVLERSEMKRLLEEQKFQYSGCVDIMCAVELGKMLGAKYMVVGSISRVGRTYSIDARLINVETGESYASASYSIKGAIDELLDTGMKSVAYQLSDLTSAVKPILNKSRKNTSINLSTNDSSRGNRRFSLASMFGATIPIGKKLLNNFSSGSNFGIRLDTPYKVGLECYFSSMSAIDPYGDPYKLTNLVGNVTIFSIPSLEIRFGIGLTPASIGDYSIVLLSIPIDFNYYLPFTISNFRFALNLHPQRTLGIPTYIGSNDEADNITDFINVGLYITR